MSQETNQENSKDNEEEEDDDSFLDEDGISDLINDEEESSSELPEPIELKSEIIDKKWNYSFDVKVNGISSNDITIENDIIHTEFADFRFGLRKTESDNFLVFAYLERLGVKPEQPELTQKPEINSIITQYVDTIGKDSQQNDENQKPNSENENSHENDETNKLKEKEIQPAQDSNEFDQIDDLSEFDLNIFMRFGQKIASKYVFFGKNKINTELKPILYTYEDELPEFPANFHISLYFTPPQNYFRTLFGAVGLINDGMTCYLNSLLESLFHIRAFRSIVFSLPPHVSEIANSMRYLFAHMQLDLFPVSTRGLTKSFGWKTNDLFNQHDAQELMCILLDRLDNHCDNKTSALFKGTTSSYIKASSYESERTEDFLSLSLEVEGIKTIEDSLKEYFNTEQLTGDNQYKLDDGTKVDAEVGTSLKIPPQILCIHLRRFTYNGDFLEKVSQKFEFSKDLDVYGTGYTLHAIVSHAGSIVGGHYCAYIDLAKGNEKDLDENGSKWFCFDDDNVRRVDSIEAIDENFGEDGNLFTAYMLFYIRTDKMDELINCDDPPVPDDIKQEFEEKMNFTKVKCTIFKPDSKDFEKKIIERVPRNLDSKDFIQLICEKTDCGFTPENIHIRSIQKENSYKIGDLIQNPVPNKCTNIFIDNTSDIPVFVSFWLPGYNVTEIGLFHCKLNSSLQELERMIIQKLGLPDSTNLLCFENTISTNLPLAPSSIETSIQIIAQPDPSDDIDFENIIKELKMEKYVPEPDSFISVLNLQFQTVKEFKEFSFSTKTYQFLKMSNKKPAFSLNLSPKLTYDQLLICVSHHLDVNPNRILLFPQFYGEQIPHVPADPNVFNSLKDLTPSYRELFFEIAPNDFTGMWRYDVTIASNEHEEIVRFPVYQPAHSSAAEVLQNCKKATDDKIFEMIRQMKEDEEESFPEEEEEKEENTEISKPQDVQKEENEQNEEEKDEEKDEGKDEGKNHINQKKNIEEYGFYGILNSIPYELNTSSPEINPNTRIIAQFNLPKKNDDEIAMPVTLLDELTNLPCPNLVPYLFYVKPDTTWERIKKRMKKGKKIGLAIVKNNKLKRVFHVKPDQFKPENYIICITKKTKINSLFLFDNEIPLKMNK